MFILLLRRFWFVYSEGFSSSISLVISSIGFGGGVVAIVHPIHAPINRTAMNAMNTGIATNQNRTSKVIVIPRYAKHSMNMLGQISVIVYPIAIIKHTKKITPPIA